MNVSEYRRWIVKAALRLGGLFLVVLVYLGFVVFTNMPVEYLSNVFDPNRLLKKSDVVCKGKVQVWAAGAYVSIHTLSRIKGNPPDFFIIKYTHNALLDLAPGETAILFLKGGFPYYTYVEPHNGKISAASDAASENFGDQPEDRLLAELVQTAKYGKGKARINAIDQLGILGDARVKPVLAPLCNSHDPTLAGMAMASGIRVGEVPDFGTLLAYVRRQPDPGEEARLFRQFGTNKYRLTAIQRDIFQALDESVKQDSDLDRVSGDFVEEKGNDFHLQVRHWDFGPVHGLDQFDYVGFFGEALKLNSLNTEPDLNSSRRVIASALARLGDRKALPLIRGLMADANVYVRYSATIGLLRIYGDGEWPSLPRYREHEAIYRAYWDQKLKTETGERVPVQSS